MDNNNSSPKKPPTVTAAATATPPVGSGSGSGTGDRLKRDEWSEGAVSSLLEAYETKWILRNRAKLKGHDWEDVAKHVSSRANSTKSHKTLTQCKNKIESMKKRYRSESATADVSSWPLFPRLDLLLRGSGGGGSPVVTTGGDLPPCAAVTVASSVPVVFDHHVTVAQAVPITTAEMVMVRTESVPAPVTVATPVVQGIRQNSVDSNGVELEIKVSRFLSFIFYKNKNNICEFLILCYMVHYSNH